jgi:hypothetical protein
MLILGLVGMSFKFQRRKSMLDKAEQLVNLARAQQILKDPFTWKYRVKAWEFIGQIYKRLYV